MGRRFYLLAAACHDKTVRIFKITPVAGAVAAGSKYTVEEVLRSEEHNDQVWRVSWNITGTVLASSGDDGTVRLWQTDFDSKWQCSSVIEGGLGVVG